MQEENPVSLLFRARLQSLLAERDLSQRQLALATGVSQQTINNYLRGVTKLPGAEELLALSRFFGVPMEHFVTDNENVDLKSSSKPTSKSLRPVAAAEVRRSAERLRRQADELRAEADRLGQLGGDD